MFIKTLEGNLTFNQEVSKDVFFGKNNLLDTVYYNGNIVKHTNFNQIKSQVRSNNA